MILIDDGPAALLDEDGEVLIDELGDEEYSIGVVAAYVAGPDQGDGYLAGPRRSVPYIAGPEAAMGRT